MTIAPHREPLEVRDIEQASVAIRARGGRLTTARRVLLEALFAADGLVTAEALARGLGGRVVPTDLSSVYRNLELLEQLGVVRHVHAGHGPGLYGLERGEHVEYLVCETCDRVDAVPSAALDGVRAELAERFGYHVRFGHFPLVGRCSGCAGG